MTDKEFINYLAKKLLYSGEDCCSICAYYPSDDEICDGIHENCTLCVEGMRAYAERTANQK